MAVHNAGTEIHISLLKSDNNALQCVNCGENGGFLTKTFSKECKKMVGRGSKACGGKWRCLAADLSDMGGNDQYNHAPPNISVKANKI